MKEPIFESERLYYSPISGDDIDFYHTLHSDNNVMEFTRDEKDNTIEDTRENLKRIITSDDILWIAISKEHHEPIGIVGYNTILRHHSGGIVEIGYALMPQYWGVGYATEMGKSIIQYIFKETHIHKINGRCHIDNIASQKILEKLGMSKEGVSGKVRYKNGRWIDEVQYSLLRE